MFQETLCVRGQGGLMEAGLELGATPSLGRAVLFFGKLLRSKGDASGDFILLAHLHLDE